ncbi:hypothetical protein GM658_28310 [Pseudoduganella eburnea]|uniref:Uncharacterized protein n=1 Tax=Massilia eburnea TaxID=1776165 RepID=A0A6L6QQZ7_9BURK|nr:hypothetical protein [Massilia eburnea]MTW14524.1 hypothetical protein [Massilia eburnea]
MLMLLAVLPAAQATDCPVNLRWEEGTFAERITIQQGEGAHVVVEKFADATALHVDVSGAKAAMITLAGKGDDGSISFLSAPEHDKPSGFAEISMAVDVPFGTDPNLAGPCALEDEVTVQALDLAGRLADKLDLEQSAGLKGWMRRQGLDVEYSVQFGPGAELQGLWRYTSRIQNVPLDIDVQGWRVFKRDTLLTTLPKGKPIPLSAALEQLRGAK